MVLNLYVNCVSDAFHTRSGNWTTLEYVDVIIHIMRFGP